MVLLKNRLLKILPKFDSFLRLGLKIFDEENSF
jgi:hypothetical protein